MTPKELKSWRIARDMRVNVLAHKLKIAPRTVFRWESGDTPLPSDLQSRLDVITTVTEPTEQKPHKPAGDVSSETPHGQVIGLYRDFWTKQTDADRVAWIMDPSNEPRLALPWPWWSHGWTFYSPVRRLDNGQVLRAEPLPHYLADWASKMLMRRMREEAGNTDERLRKAVIFYCRRDNPSQDWFAQREAQGMPVTFETLQQFYDELGVPSKNDA